MVECKFKLKKDGTCAGYLRFHRFNSPGGLLFLDESEDGIEWHGGERIDFDSIHPFVCQDRNGKDVYEGDKFLDRRDSVIETMSPRFWFLSLEEDSHGIELIPDEVKP